MGDEGMTAAWARDMGGDGADAALQFASAIEAVAPPDAGPSAAPIGVRLQSVSKRYGHRDAVSKLSLDIAKGEFITILGPSGSGKTTTLMMIAGFTMPSEGRIVIGGRDVTNAPPHQRDIGVVFQSYALFPHLSVFRNVAFPLEARRMPRKTIEQRVRQALELVKLGELADRYPGQLSGGQQQRVALARAFVFEPPLLLMDEPLGALDKKLREHMQVELMKLKNQLDLTVVYVTHDQEEALVMSDRIVVMENGTIQQIGSPEDLYRRPANRFVADFIGEANILEGRIVESGAHLVVEVGGGMRLATVAGHARNVGDRAAIVLRPECITIGRETAGCANRFDTIIEQAIYVGEASRYVGKLPNGQIITAKLQHAAGKAEIAPGDRVSFGWNAAQSWLVPSGESTG